jgi:N-acetylglutamate synthase-like GNAT family acetyltransferase
MDCSYLTDWVFDPDQETVLALSDGAPAGALCLARFPKHSFAEIVFIAVKSEVRSAGIGRYLIRRMHARLQSEGLRNFIVSADDSAIVFFRRSGFSAHFPPEAPREFFASIVCSYEHSTLMVLTIGPEIDYAGMDDWIDRVAAEFEGTDDYPVRRFRRFPIETVKGIPVPQSDAKAPPQDVMARLIKELLIHPASVPFRYPVREDIHPTYRAEIEQPIDLTIIEKLVRDGHHRKLNAFFRDVRLIFANCARFFEEDTKEYRLSKELQEYLETLCQRIGVAYPPVAPKRQQ